MRPRTAFALFMEMRCGKTKCILDEFGELATRGDLSRLLVVAPAGVYRTWETDIAKHLGDALRRRTEIRLWDSQAATSVKHGLERFVATSGPKIFLVNIEALSTVLAAQKLVAQFLKKAPAMMVIDESTVIKNLDAKRTRFCVAAGQHAAKRRILSGLPSPQSPLDLYAQCRFLDPAILGFGDFQAFQDRYAVTSKLPVRDRRGRKHMIDVVNGYRDLDDLSAKILPHAFRVRLADCYDLPPKIYMRRDIELTSEQKRAYGELVTYATTVLKNAERVTATMVLTQLLRLHQIVAGHTKSDDGVESEIPENKTSELLSVLEQHRGKAIIWVAYDADIRRLTSVLTKTYGAGSVARFWGGNADTRELEEKQFLNDPNCRFMIATAASGGRGRTWAVADTIIYYSNTFSLEHRMQSEERAQGIGKVNSVLYVDLVARDTVEEKILHALRDKMSLSDAVTGDNWRSWVV